MANRVDPIYTRNDYSEFPNSFSVRQTLTADLVEFDRYANFSESSITATKIRESIAADINISTPSNFVKPKDEVQQFITMKAGRPNQVQELVKKEKSQHQLTEDYKTELTNIWDGFNLF